MLDQKLKKKATHRARIIRGQLDGLVKAIEEEQYCVDLITQSRSIQLSLKSMDRILLANHLQGHMKHMLNDTKQESKAIKELVDLYALSNK
jgi:DNA-binding FrmR family transcriptional regulator